MGKPSKGGYFSPKSKEEFQNPNAIVVTASGVKISPSKDDTSKVASPSKPKPKSNDPLSIDAVDEKLSDTRGSDQANYDREKIIGEVNPYTISPTRATTSNTSTKTPSASSLRFKRSIIRYDSLYFTSCSAVLLEVAIFISVIICILTGIPSHCGKDKKQDNSSVSCSYIAKIYFIFNITSIGIQLLLLSFYTFHFIEYADWIPWLSIEVVIYFLITVGHLVIGSICIATSSGLVFAAGVLGIFLAFISLMQFGTKFYKCRKGHYAQPGEGDPDNEDVRLTEGRKRFRISKQANPTRSPGRFWKL